MKQIDEKVKTIIHQNIKAVWMNQIQKDYFSNKLLKEDSLKNAFYHHLRSSLGDTFLDEHNLYIYTELNDGPLKGTGKRADVAIVQLDERYNESSDEYCYLGDYISNVVAIFELKYKAGYAAIKEIQSDVQKLKSYIEDNQIDAMYYLMAISELAWEKDSFIEKEKDAWAKGKVTELVATYREAEDDVIFGIIEY